MKAIKRLAAMLLALVLFVGLLPATIPEANAAISTSTFETKVQEFISDSRWKNGIAWADSQTPKLSSWSSTGCCAYAADFVAYVYGSTSAAWTSSDFTKFTDLNEIRAGDIIHTSNHWFVVLERNGDTFRTAEGNFDDKTRVCSDGWGIKNGQIYNLKATDGARTFEYGYHYNFSDSSTTTYSSSQIYHNIDMSAAVLASRTNQQVSGDCAVVSMATVEAYMYGATSTADKNTVYNALVSKNGDNDYAYWSNCGYVSYSSINWTTVYNQLSKGYPVIVHRPATSSKVQHWAVVAGYKGSTTTLETDKFIIVDVYHGSGGTDIYTSASWASGTSIDRMVTRKNGISITSLSGIKMAINHPAAVHQYGEGHGVYGYVTSNINLTSVQVTVTNTGTGTVVYNKTITPNAKSYLIYNLDSEMTFAKWAKGKYSYTVTAKTASSSRTYQYAFEIASGWPVDQPLQSYVFTFDANGGTGAPANQTVTFGGSLYIPAAIPTRAGYTFQGWYAMRNGDQTWYCAGNGWNTDAQITASGYTKKLYPTATEFIINNSWLSGCMETTGFTLYAQWEENAVSTYTISYNANGGSGAPASQTKTAGTALTLSTVKPTREGYTFQGWATSATATTAAYQPGASFTTDANTTLYAVWEQNEVTGAKVVISNETVAPGSTVTVEITASDLPVVKSLIVECFEYDTNALEYVSAELNVTGAFIADWDDEAMVATVAFTENMDINGVIMTLTFMVKDDAEGNYSVSCDVSANQLQDSGSENAVDLTVVSGTVAISSYQRGDVNGDGYVNSDDAIYLLRYTLSPNRYPINQSGDMNGDGFVNSDDAIYLLRYTLSPSRYPLN